jgi:hypothetical protein
MMKKLVFFFFLMLAAFFMKRKRKTESSPIRDPNARRASTRRAPLVAKNTWSIVRGFLSPQNEQKFNEIHKSLSQFPTKYENISKSIKDRLHVNENMAWLFFKHSETQKVVAVNVTEKTYYEITPLLAAAVLNEVEIAKAVVEAGVDIDAKPEHDLNSMTPLRTAILMGSGFQVTRMLIGAGGSILHFGMTALHWAAILNYLEIGKVLVEGGADLSVRWNSQTALEIGKVLVEGGADLSVRWNSQTALEIGKVLVEGGADLSVRWNSQTALEIAIQRNHGEFAEMLRKHVKKNN